MPQIIAPAEALRGLPSQLQDAQRAIESDEVQQILKTLAKYNLGVFMPHMHTDDDSFTILPEGVVQVEDDLKVSFAQQGEVDEKRMIPVGWRWGKHGVTAVSDCAAAISWCHCKE